MASGVVERFQVKSHSLSDIHNDMDNSFHQDGSGDVAIKLIYGNSIFSKIFDVIRLIGSVILLVISISANIYAIIGEYTLMGDTLPIWINFLLLLVCLFYLGCLEGLQIAVVELAHNNPNIYRGKYPRAAKLLALENKGRNVERFLVGRQVLVVFIVFLLARLTSYDEFYFDIPDGIKKSIMYYGFMGVVLVVIIAQLTPQVLASAYPVQFLNLPIMNIVFYSCLLIEISGVAHAVYLLCYICKNYICKCLCNIKGIMDDDGGFNDDINDNGSTLEQMSIVADKTEIKIVNNKDKLKNIAAFIDVNVNNFSLPKQMGNILQNIYNIDESKPLNNDFTFNGYPSPNECYIMFKNAGLKPPKFLLNPDNSDHIPPHIIALKLLHMCCNVN